MQQGPVGRKKSPFVETLYQRVDDSCSSQSISSVRCPCWANSAARLMFKVDFPAPPLNVEMASESGLTVIASSSPKLR